ncbi:hypothetical protein [Clostridium sp.]|uniref:hypothetical protein n=1 Tax=Clostridium sp. TaxID=1506 RepID=UPI00284EBEA3|nr:hypothetical protein [Clostridium sp.]MDR3597766.1 hypothetical protein [Clostridium sp.]
MKKKLLVIMILSIVTSGMFIGCGSNSSKSDTVAPAKTTEAAKEPAQTTEPAKQTTKATETTNTNNQGIVQVPVTIENGTDVDFSELYTSGTKVDVWGDNLIGNGVTFSPGKAIEATFNVDVNNLKWDFKAVDGNGDSLEFQGLDLSNCNADGVKIKLTYDRSTQTGTITAE